MSAKKLKTIIDFIKSKYSTYDNTSICWYDFNTDNGEKCQPDLNLVSNNDDIQHDSYGYENSTLERVYYYKPLNTYIKCNGVRASHYGEEWHEPIIVKPKKVTIIKYE